MLHPSMSSKKPTEQNDRDKPSSSKKRRRALRKKLSDPERPSESDCSETLQPSLEELNKQILKRMHSAIDAFDSVDMTEAMAEYSKMVPHGAERSSSSTGSLSDSTGAGGLATHSVLPMERGSQYEALKELFVGKPAKRCDSLEAFLRESMPPELEEEGVPTYIRPEDVIRSRGTALHGPRREDVGRFNRKVFEAYDNQLSDEGPFLDIEPNIRFYGSIREILKEGEIQSCMEATLITYDPHGRPEEAPCLFVIYTTHDGEPACAAVDLRTMLFHKFLQAGLVAALRSPRDIVFMSLDDCVLRHLLFNAERHGNLAFSSFFARPTGRV